MSIKQTKRMISQVFTVFMGLMCVLLILTSCSNELEGQGDNVNDGKISILSTTTMLNDMANVIGGDLVDAQSLVGPGVDPHTYQASAGDVETMTDADVVIYNGYNLEAKMTEIFASLKDQDKNVICVEDALDSADILADPENPSADDPHIWNDVQLWIQVGEHVAERLGEIDPDNKDVYAQNMADYKAELEEIEEYVIERTNEIPEDQRILVTAHDAFGYFNSAYGYTVRGLQGISTETEAGTSDVSELADFIVENKLKAIFVESAVTPKTIEALQAAVKDKGHDVAIGGTLYADSLGDEKSGTETYLKTLKHNIDTIANALK